MGHYLSEMENPDPIGPLPIKRPKPKSLGNIDFRALRKEIIDLIEVTLDDLDEGYDPETFEEKGNSNEDILNDNNELVYEAVVKAIYGEEYFEYFNKRV